MSIKVVKQMNSIVNNDFGKVSFVGDKIACFLNNNTRYVGYLKSITDDFIFIQSEDNNKNIEKISVDEVKTVDCVIASSEFRRSL